MSRIAFQDESLVPTGLSPERARRWCVLASLRTLRLSVQRGRTMSLPNLLRLYRRQWAEVAAELGVPADADRAAMWLTRLYRAEQPFEDTDWRWCRRRLMMLGLAIGDSPTHGPYRSST